MLDSLKPIGKRNLTEEECLEVIARQPDKNDIKDDNQDEFQGEVQERTDNQLPTVSLEEDFIKLEGVVCYASDNSIIEQYDELFFSRDIVRKQDGSYKSFTPYEAISYFEKQGLFLPSSALSCVILASLFKNAVKKNKQGEYVTINQELESVLQQYKDYGVCYGWHNVNTVIDYKNERIIHYPYDSDFPQHGGTDDVNQGRRKDLSFSKSDLKEGKLSEKLQIPSVNQFVLNFSGLQDPSILISVGDYFEKPGYIWFRDSSFTGISSAWLGCNGNYFYLVAYDYLSYGSAARSVAQANFFSIGNRGLQ